MVYGCENENIQWSIVINERQPLITGSPNCRIKINLQRRIDPLHFFSYQFIIRNIVCIRMYSMITKSYLIRMSKQSLWNHISDDIRSLRHIKMCDIESMTWTLRRLSFVYAWVCVCAEHLLKTLYHFHCFTLNKGAYFNYGPRGPDDDLSAQSGNGVLSSSGSIICSS